MDRGDTRVELAVALREDVEHRGGLAARARVGRGRSAPREQRLARLADALARERRAVREQRVDVEDHEPAWGEARSHAGERGGELGLVPQVVERVVEAGDEVE